MTDLLARKRSPPPGRRNRPGHGSLVSFPSGQLSREEKTIPFKNPMLEEQLRLAGHHMELDIVGPRPEFVMMCDELMNKTSMEATDNGHGDACFAAACEAIRNRNEDKIIRETANMIIPSVDVFSARGEIEIKDLAESVNEPWIAAYPLLSIRPQPDFATGFKPAAFTEDQIKKILPILGDVKRPVSHFKATWYLYFPFLGCEVNKVLDVADRQNAHSMGIAMQAVVKLFTLANREHELDRKILAFSISYDDRTVRIYGYYPVIGDENTSYHRHQISVVDFQSNVGKDRWKAYCFVRSLYASWAPEHLTMLHSALDALPTNILPLLSARTHGAVKTGEKRRQFTSTGSTFFKQGEVLQPPGKRKK